MKFSKEELAIIITVIDAVSVQGKDVEPVADLRRKVRLALSQQQAPRTKKPKSA